MDAVYANIDETGFVVIVAESGGSKTALADRIEAEAPTRWRREVLLERILPVASRDKVAHEAHHPMSKEIQDAFVITREWRKTYDNSPILVLENVHLDALGFLKFWKFWSERTKDERPLLVVTTRPYFLDALDGERLQLNLPVPHESESGRNSFAEGLRDLREDGGTPIPGFLNLEVQRGEIFALHARKAFEPRQLNDVSIATLKEACGTNQEVLRILVETCPKDYPAAAWTAAGLRDSLYDEVYERQLALERFTTGEQAVPRRDAFLRVCAFRRFEALAPAPANGPADWLVLHKGLVLVGSSECILTMHPDHAALILESAAVAGADDALPDWVLSPGGRVLPLLEPTRGGEQGELDYPSIWMACSGKSGGIEGIEIELLVGGITSRLGRGLPDELAARVLLMQFCRNRMSAQWGNISAENRRLAAESAVLFTGVQIPWVRDFLFPALRNSGKTGRHRERDNRWSSNATTGTKTGDPAHIAAALHKRIIANAFEGILNPESFRALDERTRNHTAVEFVALARAEVKSSDACVENENALMMPFFRLAILAMPHLFGVLSSNLKRQVADLYLEVALGESSCPPGGKAHHVCSEILAGNPGLWNRLSGPKHAKMAKLSAFLRTVPPAEPPAVSYSNLADQIEAALANTVP